MSGVDLLVIGGAASGKSAYAEERCRAFDGRLVYVATMEAFGAEGRARVERHRALREGKGFATVERSRDLAGLAAEESALDGATVLLEGLGTLAANELFAPVEPTPADDDPVASDDSDALDDGVCAAVVQRIEDGLQALDARANHLICVTDAVSSDGVTYPAGTRAYQRVLAEANRFAAAHAREVVEVVCGIPVPVDATSYGEAAINPVLADPLGVLPAPSSKVPSFASLAGIPDGLSTRASSAPCVPERAQSEPGNAPSHIEEEEA